MFQIGRMVKLALVKKNPSIPVKICFLAEVPEAVPKLVKLFQEEWEAYYGPDGPGIAESDIWECCQINSIPLTLVAIDENGEVIGTGTLRAKPVDSVLDQGPWITALVVEKSRRGNGIGTALISALEMEARRFRSSSIYTSTHTSGGILLSRGWQAIDKINTFQGVVTIYRTELQQSTAKLT